MSLFWTKLKKLSIITLLIGVLFFISGCTQTDNEEKIENKPERGIQNEAKNPNIRR